MKKHVIKFALLSSVLGLSLAAAQDATDYENVDPSGQEVTFWHNQTGPNEELVNQFVQEFNDSNEYGITVTATNQGDYGDIFQKMLPLLNTDEAPDLVVAYQNQAASYQLGDALLDMDPLVESAKWGLSEADQTDFFPSFFEQDIFPTFDNERLGFPPNRSMEVLYYNSEWLTELGFDGPPETPDEFREMACAAAQTPFSKATGQGSSGYLISVDASRVASWAFAYGGDVYDYDANQYTYDSPAVVDSLTFLQGLVNDGCAGTFTEDYGDQTAFGTGNALFAIGSTSGLPFYKSGIEEGANFEWSVAALPHTGEPSQNIYGASVSMPKHTPESELATWLFIKYYTSPDVQARWAGTSGYFPVRQSVADQMTDYFAENPGYKTAFDLIEYGKAEPPVPGYDFVRDLIEETFAGILTGDEVADALADANEEANDILSEQMEEMQAGQ